MNDANLNKWIWNDSQWKVRVSVVHAKNIDINEFKSHETDGHALPGSNARITQKNEQKNTCSFWTFHVSKPISPQHSSDQRAFHLSMIQFRKLQLKP